ncbi:MAG: hypothetical protein WBE76_04110 [Terracidiphilus sp.]
MESSHSAEMPLVFDCSRLVLPALSIPGYPRVVENLAYYGSLAAKPLPRYWNSLGSDLEELQTAQSSLYSWEHMLRTWRPAEIESKPAPSLPNISICGLEFTADELASYIGVSDLPRDNARPSLPIVGGNFTQENISALPFEQIVEFFAAYASKESPSVESNRLLCWVLNGAELRSLLQRITKKIQQIKQILYRLFKTFCGQSWSRRSWFLLHGSHPPKLGPWLFQCLVVECAVP